MNKVATITLSDNVIAHAMRVALDAASAAEGATAPNPPVGCVLLDASGHVISSASHRKAGHLHAEVLAIQKARALGLIRFVHTFVVTLEPCNHYGCTPPCTDAILATPAKNVVIGAADPNPKVKGGGAERLRKGGLGVSFLDVAREPELFQALQRLIAPFTKRMTKGLPWVTVKQALNRRGSMIPELGHKTFTSHASLVFAHQLRRRADAIITGSGTVLADAPEFTVRHVEDIVDKRRKLILFDRRRRVANDYVASVIKRGFEVIWADELQQVLRALATEGTLEVLVEAGPHLTASVLSSPYWDEHVLITQSPKVGHDDQIDIKRNTLSLNQSAEEDNHVFRDH